MNINCKACDATALGGCIPCTCCASECSLQCSIECRSACRETCTGSNIANNLSNADNSLVSNKETCKIANEEGEVKSNV